MSLKYKIKSNILVLYMRELRATYTQPQIRAAQRAFYVLQRAVLCYKSVPPSTALNMFSTAVRSVLLYGCNGIHLNRSNLTSLDSAQGKFNKSAWYFQNIHVQHPFSKHCKCYLYQRISNAISVYSLDLLIRCVLSNSQIRPFYCHLKENKNKNKNKNLFIASRWT